MKVIKDAINNVVLERIRDQGHWYYGYFDDNGIFQIKEKSEVPDTFVDNCWSHNPSKYRPRLKEYIINQNYYRLSEYDIQKCIAMLKPGDTLKYLDTRLRYMHDGINHTWERIDGSKGIKIKSSIYNTVIRIYDKYAYYFNSNGIYCSIPIDKMHNSNLNLYFVNMSTFYTVKHSYHPILILDEKYIFENNGNTISSNNWRAIISTLEVGDTLKYFDKMINSSDILLYATIHNEARLIKNCIIGASTPIIERRSDNKNERTFDFIRIFIRYKDIPNYRNCIKDNIRYIVNMAVDAIKNNNKYKKYNVPVNFLKLTNVTILNNTNQIMLIFELKNIEGGEII